MIEHPFIAAIALVLILEGIMPFVAPGQWKQMLAQISQMSDKNLRIMGAAMMVIGVLIFKMIQA
ncbi:DUF2065 domain-containing protein [Marinicella gelatinilytica]|uniref:DUF2065 domain-containing protein n=1 Tax=Marinicella gelatinilytica TaxID=2996017 RepID=UPI002260F90F|nr:DUF2065 domain-containing protein [Marinicella gelatinilytica]MCX7545717.1 DUF2065 domain-containing protein [Marinicella gelatinilytica]